eukprot:scaffold1279_cov124-Skeletonema_dohrnii-CCMP3373.AAC.8
MIRAEVCCPWKSHYSATTPQVLHELHHVSVEETHPTGVFRPRISCSNREKEMPALRVEGTHDVY